MAYTAEDAIHQLTGGDSVDQRSSERFSAEVAAVNFMGTEQIKRMFPDVEFAASENIVYAPVKMCHSLPKINKRRRTFTAKTLARSHPSARDQLVDINHEVASNSNLFGKRVGNNICGHIKRTHLGMISVDVAAATLEIEEFPFVPESPIPLHALVALYMRHDQVEEIVKNHKSGKEPWSVSMECGHAWKESDLYHRGEFIPFMEAPGKMLEGIKKTSIDPYDGHEVAAVLGGKDGTVDFWGLGLTRNPADDEGNILSMFAGTSFEVAHTGRKLFLPFSSVLSDKSSEAASAVDKKFEELASIKIMGETNESMGHVHEVLSDGTVLPSGDLSHVHYIQNFSLERGSNPSFTAITDNSHRAIGMDHEPYREVVHSHYISIPLKGKKVDSSADVSISVASLDSNFEGECEMKFQAMLDRLEKLASKLDPEGKGGSDGLASEIASLKDEITSYKAEDELKEAIAKEIADKQESGDLLSKEKHEELVSEAVAKALADEKSKHDQEKKKQDRFDALKEAGINLGYKYDEKEDLTVQMHIESMPLNEDGDKEFDRHLVSLKHMVLMQKNEEEKELEKKKAPAEANTGNNILAGGGPTEKEPEAADASSEKPEKKKIGKAAVTCLS